MAVSPVSLRMILPLPIKVVEVLLLQHFHSSWLISTSRDKRYLESAKHTADYLEKELISKADYFSSTLDANCEDKEASLYAATATYYLALITKGEERKHYADLTREAAYFALSWYYVWDVPFADGEMLEILFQTQRIGEGIG